MDWKRFAEEMPPDFEIAAFAVWKAGDQPVILHHYIRGRLSTPSVHFDGIGEDMGAPFKTVAKHYTHWCLVTPPKEEQK